MANEYVLIIYYVMWGLLVFTAITFLISGLDDLFFDLYYWAYYVWRLFALRKKAKRLTYETLANHAEKRIAIMVPCWHEAGVIEEMLRYNVYGIDYDQYDIFIGVYPNDPKTVASVQSVEKIVPHVHAVIKDQDGPSNKADNLNSVYKKILEYEKQHNLRYEIFVMQDSEDVIHPLSLKLYNYLMPKNHMIQIPIFPLQIDLHNMTHWTYNAEFSEIHTKDIIVREKIGGLVPSAGVGTAFSREVMEALSEIRHGVPFAINTLTEDYSTALQIRLQNLRGIFVLRYVYHTEWKKHFFFFGKPVPRRVREYIATRALFPMTYTKAVRQKTRWILGISFQEWINTGWVGNIATMYTLIHDRKSIFTHLVNGLFFLLIPFWMLYALFTYKSPEYPTLQDAFEKNQWVWILIVISSFLMINRIIQRAIAVWRVYGIIPALWSIPLILYGNVINLHALFRAYGIFIFSPKTKSGSPVWDKTDHTFPVQKLLLPYKEKLGDLLVKKKIITVKQLDEAIEAQNRTGEQLGKVFLKLGFIDHHELTKVLGEQYHLDLIRKEDVMPMPFESIPYLSRYRYDCLMDAKCYPLGIAGEQLTLTLPDPSNDILISRVIFWAQPYKPKFLLLD